MNFLQKQNFLREVTKQTQPDSIKMTLWNAECIWRKNTRYDQWHTSANVLQGDIN